MTFARAICAFLVVAAGCTGSPADQEIPESADAVRPPGQIIAEATSDEWIPLDPDYALQFSLPQGDVLVTLTRDLSPAHVEQIRQLAQEGYYDGLHFYRVVEGFVAQGGDARGEKLSQTGADSMLAEFDMPVRPGMSFVSLGNSDGYADEAGFLNGFPVAKSNADNKIWMAHCAGALAFGRGNSPNSASTEIYITLQPQRYLDRNLTVVGRVVWGMEHVQSINRGLPGNSGTIVDESRWTEIQSMRLLADIPVYERVSLEQMDTNSDSYRELIESRRNRPEEFFVFRPDFIDLCQMPLPVRQTSSN